MRLLTVVVAGVLATGFGCNRPAAPPERWVTAPGENEERWDNVAGYIHHRDAVDFNYMSGREVKRVRVVRPYPDNQPNLVFQVLCDLEPDQKGWAVKYRERDVSSGKFRTVYQFHVHNASEWIGTK